MQRLDGVERRAALVVRSDAVEVRLHERSAAEPPRRELGVYAGDRCLGDVKTRLLSDRCNRCAQQPDKHGKSYAER